MLQSGASGNVMAGLGNRTQSHCAVATNAAWRRKQASAQLAVFFVAELRTSAAGVGSDLHRRPHVGRSPPTSLKIRRGRKLDAPGFYCSHNRPEMRTLRSFKLQMPDTDLLAKLESLPAKPKMYWSARDGSLELAGWGVAEEITARDAASLLRKLKRKQLTASPDACYLGGMRFEPHGTPDAGWRPFGIGRFILPSILLRRENGRTVAIGYAADAGAAQRLQKLLQRPTIIPAPLRLHWLRAGQTSDRPDWLRSVTTAIHLIQQGRLRKIVLARRSRLRLTAACSPWSLLRQLKAGKANCSLFCFQPTAGQAFLGATPERLYRRDGRFIESEALAGTRPRGHGRGDDQRLGRQLLRDAKEREEHRLVVDAIAQSLQPLCADLHVDRNPTLRRLDSVQHLFTQITGRLQADVADADLIRRLHPTPAVGGTPRAAARRHIAALEPFDRGWYAGLVGWLSAGEAELAVAIRSGLLRGQTLSVYTGAGIVRDSVPAAEWEEVEHKLAGFLDRLRHAG